MITFLCVVAIYVSYFNPTYYFFTETSFGCEALLGSQRERISIYVFSSFFHLFLYVVISNPNVLTEYQGRNKKYNKTKKRKFV